MRKYDLGQDEFLFNLYYISFIITLVASYFSGDLSSGLKFLFQPGTFDEIENNSSTFTFSSSSKITAFMLLASAAYFGSSCAAGITKHFGAFVMSITGTTRKSFTLFFSFFVYQNECTSEHITGIVVFFVGILIKSFNGKFKSQNISNDSYERCQNDMLTSCVIKLDNNTDDNVENKEIENFEDDDLCERKTLVCT